MMEKIKVKNKYERKWIILGIVYVLFIVCAPIAIEKLIIANSYSSGASNDGWASFFGSYLGGVFGGTATLMAVLITIRNGKKEQEEEIAREKEELIRKSALIVYYDFEFFSHLLCFSYHITEMHFHLSKPIGKNAAHIADVC